jgi:hypothetical protein
MRATSSRAEQLRKDHEKKMIMRILFFVFLMVIVVVLLARYAIPAAVSIANIWLQVKESDATPAQQVQQVYLSPPNLEGASRELTKNSTITIKGSTESGSKVFLMLNEQASGDLIADSEGNFEFTSVSLREGENLVYVYREDERGNKSNPSRSSRILLDTEAPSVSVEKPFSGESFRGQSQRTIEVKGSSDGADYVFVNDSRVIMDDDGLFVQRLRLEPGENAIKIKAVDEAGNESVEVTRTVRWEE